MGANLVITVCMYLPVMKQVKILFRSRTVKDGKVAFVTETSFVSCKSNMETDDTEKSSSSNKLKGIGIISAHKKVQFETSGGVDCMPYNVTTDPKTAENNKKPNSKALSGQKRVTIMFFLSHCDVCLVVHTPAHYLDSFIYVGRHQFIVDQT